LAWVFVDRRFDKLNDQSKRDVCNTSLHFQTPQNHKFT